MDKPEKIDEFYLRKFGWLPENFGTGLGHFNIFRLEPFVEGKAVQIPYRRRDFYEIMLVKGNSKVHFADQVVEIKEQALSFSNPFIPYKWEHLDKIREGIYCIFDPHFFHQFGQFQQYEVFQPNGQHIFELTDEHCLRVEETFERMMSEFGSDYKYKFDLIRNLIFELLHFALKLEGIPNEKDEKSPSASRRIATLFMELLERQFPIDDRHPGVLFRTPSDFAHQLNVHVNHLNRSLKQITQKTTSQLISERILQEAKVLLKHTNQSVADVAFSLGFTEATHFNNFFKKHVQLSPTEFRRIN
ncbi:MAG: helix-turn-helix transcriptional regulator [Bacteroidota bacterium]